MDTKPIDTNTKWHKAMWGLAYCVFNNLKEQHSLSEGDPRWVRTGDVWKGTPDMWENRQQVYNFVNHKRLRENGLVERNWSDVGGGFEYHLTYMGVEWLAEHGAPEGVPAKYRPQELIEYLEGYSGVIE